MGFMRTSVGKIRCGVKPPIRAKHRVIPAAPSGRRVALMIRAMLGAGVVILSCALGARSFAE